MAQSLGLLHQLVAADQLDIAVQRQIRLLLSAAPQAASSAKALVRSMLPHCERDAIDAANAALIARLRVSPEGQEGLGAFLDKRPPAWASEENA